MQTPFAPVSEQYFNGQMTAAQLLGINPGGHRGPGAGQALPASHAGAGDGLAVWYNPDSPVFWVVAVGVLTVFGMAGADARVRIGRRRAAVSLGST